MSNATNAANLNGSDLLENTDYFLSIERPAGSAVTVPFRLSEKLFAEADSHVIVQDRSKFDVLKDLARYPSVLALADLQAPSAYSALEASSEKLFTGVKSVFIFGAHKVGAKIARFCMENGIEVKGFVDNNSAKHGKNIDGIRIVGPDAVDGKKETVIVASGHHSNAILRQLKDLEWTHVRNMHELLFALKAPHGGESDFRTFSSALETDAFRFISAFLALDDEQSRKVFDGLIQMRRTLETEIADSIKSPFADEYLDATYIQASDIAYYVDAGAFTGDSIDRLEKRFGNVTHAYLFEPELPAYYEGLKKYADRSNVFFYNLGLSSKYQKFTYRPALSCDLLQEINNRIPNDIVSYIQAIRLDDVVTSKVTLFKLDIEGAEADALQGAAGIIRAHHPKLCVCTYHRSDDLWKLIDEVKAIDNSYKVGLRHYADIIEDSSFYFY